jgi:para-nitrobenzyl esterase
MNDPIVTTAAGRVRGAITEHGLVFRGIPYAAPPRAERRFAAPSPPQSWSGVRDCSTFGPICPQMPILAVGPIFEAMAVSQPMDEDCLALNVWTPALDDARRPTMVWIHGGAYTMGSGSDPQYDGGSFTREGVVYVSINYRLHALGFLYLDELFDDATGTGNLGIMDQIAALEWVRDNIAAFGGDPDNVTIFGESAGGMSVGTLLGTPSSKGLLHRAVVQSGGACHHLSAESATRVTARTLEMLGVRAGDWGALRAVSPERLVTVATEIAQFQHEELLSEEPKGMRLAYAPVVDGTTRMDRADRIVAEGGARDIELMVGDCEDEYRLFLFGMGEAMAQLIPDPDVEAFLPGHTRDEIFKVYGAGREASSVRDLAAAVATDGVFAIPSIRLAEAQIAAGGSVRMFRFSWPTPVLEGKVGACHAIDLPFVFDALAFWTGFVGPDAPQSLATDIHSAWVRFATTGDPSGGNLGDWPRYDVARRAVMVFDEHSRVIDDPRADERRMWDGRW